MGSGLGARTPGGRSASSHSPRAHGSSARRTGEGLRSRPPETPVRRTPDLRGGRRASDLGPRGASSRPAAHKSGNHRQPRRGGTGPAAQSGAFGAAGAQARPRGRRAAPPAAVTPVAAQRRAAPTPTRGRPRPSPPPALSGRRDAPAGARSPPAAPRAAAPPASASRRGRRSGRRAQGPAAAAARATPPFREAAGPGAPGRAGGGAVPAAAAAPSRARGTHR